MVIILLTSIGLVNLDAFYPFILVFLAVSELEIVQSMIAVLYRRLAGLFMLTCITIMSMYLAAYYRFLNRECLEVTECYEKLLRGMIDLPNTASWLEFSIVIGLILMVFNLFLGLIIDSIADARSRATYITSLLSERCFICDLSKVDFEHAKLNF